jgi:hypothetical protein
MQKHPNLSLVEHFKNLVDPRVNRTQAHDPIDILVIAVCTLLRAGESFHDREEFGRAKREWFQTFLSLRHGIPSHDTFNRVFAAIDPQQFLDCFLRWTQSVRQAVPDSAPSLNPFDGFIDGPSLTTRERIKAFAYSAYFAVLSFFFIPIANDKSSMTIFQGSSPSSASLHCQDEMPKKSNAPFQPPSAKTTRLEPKSPV